MTGVRNDHVVTCTKSEQVLMGEKIKNILNHKYEGKPFSSVYNEFAKEKLELILTWHVVDSRDKMATFLLREFQIIVKQQADESQFSINLLQVSGGIMSHINRYLDDKVPDDKKVKQSRVESLVSNIKAWEAPVVINPKNETKNEMSPTSKEVIKPFMSMVSPRDFLKPVIKEEVTPLPKVEEIIPQKDLPLPEIGIKPKNGNEKMVMKNEEIHPKDIPHYVERFKHSLGVFFSSLTVFEKQFNHKELLDLNNVFSYGELSGYIQTIIADDLDSAFLLEKAIREYLNVYEIYSNTCTRSGLNLKVDCSVILKGKKEKRSNSGRFVLPPGKEADLEEIITRLHRVSYLGKPSVVREPDYFEVRLQTKEFTRKICVRVSSMGWKIKLNDESFYIIIEPFSVPPFDVEEIIVTKEDQKSEVMTAPIIEKTDEISETDIVFENKNPEIIEEAPIVEDITEVKTEVSDTGKECIFEEEAPKATLVGELKKVNSLCPPVCKVAHNKKEAIEKLQSIYLDQATFMSFSAFNQQKITSVLQKFWLKEHPEDYAILLLEYLEKY